MSTGHWRSIAGIAPYRAAILTFASMMAPVALAQEAQPALAESPEADQPAGVSAGIVATIPVDETSKPQEAAPEEGQRGGSRLIEEIIVTAQKREENIKDVPISIAAFSAEALDAKGISAQQDLPRITPGLTFSNAVGFSTAYIRGIGSDAFILADPLVVTYIDGVYFPASSAQFQDFGTVERVEISKGPQGTLFGRNALGGVISVTTKDPSLEGFEAIAGSSYTSFSGSKASRMSWSNSVHVSLPMTDTWALGVSGLYSRNDPYYDQRVGSDQALVDDGRAYAFRIKSLWQPNDVVKLRLNAYRFLTDDPQRNFAVNTSTTALTAAAQPQDPYSGGSINDVPVSRDRGITYFGSLEFNTNWLNIQLLGSDQDIVSDRTFDFDATPLPIAFFDVTDGPGYKGPIFSKSRSVELRFLSNENSPDWIEYVAGVYGYEQDSGEKGSVFRGGATNLQQGMFANVVVPGLADLYNNVLSAIPGLGGALPDGISVGLRGALHNESIAGYGQVTFKPLDWAALTLGARYTIDKKCVTYAEQSYYANPQSVTPLFHYDGCGSPVGALVTDDSDNPAYRSKTKRFDPKATLTFRPSDSWMGGDPLVYLSYQTATIGDTFNVISLFAAPDKALGSKIRAYELGMKTVVFDGLSSIDGAVFYYDETNAQTQVASLQSGGAVHFENVPKLRTIGAELASVSQILPSLTNDGLVFTLGVSYLDSEYREYPQGSGFDQQGIYSDTNDFTGNKVVQTPRYTVSTSINQTLEVPGGSLELGVDYYYNDGFYFLAQNTPNTEVDSYSTLGFTISYLFERWDLRVNGFGRNVLNERYQSARFTTDFGTADFPAPLAAYGLALRWNY